MRPCAGDGGAGSGGGSPSAPVILREDLWYPLGEYEWPEMARVPVLLLRVSNPVDVVLIAYG